MNLISREIFQLKKSLNDADADAFILAAAIIDGTQISAINTLVITLKNEGIWTKIKAFYPFIGGNANSHKWNLKDPRDLDVAFRLSFINTPIQDAFGMKVNGTNNYANTHLNPSTVFLDKAVCFGFYQTVISTKTGNDVHFFGADTASSTNYMDIQGNTTFTNSNFLNNATVQSMPYVGKIILINSTPTNKALYVNSNTTGYSAITGNFPNLKLWLGCMNYNNGYYSGVNSTFGAAWIMIGLTDDQVTQLRTIITTFQTALSRA